MEIGIWEVIGILIMSPVLVVAVVYILSIFALIFLIAAVLLEWIFTNIKKALVFTAVWFKETVKR